MPLISNDLAAFIPDELAEVFDSTLRLNTKRVAGNSVESFVLIVMNDVSFVEVLFAKAPVNVTIVFDGRR
jgi:hypothetical protein